MSDRSFVSIFLIFLRLGLTSFGGPVAHLSYFREEFVMRRRWLSEAAYADLIALCQFLPGPASSQVGMALGLFRHGFAGCLAAWLGFTLPSALIMLAAAAGLGLAKAGVAAGLLHGLKIVAVAVVAQAVWGMAQNLCPDRPRLMIMGVTCILALTLPSAAMQIVVIVAAGVTGLLFFKPIPAPGEDTLQVPYRRRTGALLLVLFFALLAALPLAVWFIPTPALHQLDAFYRSGALVFGGGHIILPLLQNAVVAPGWVDNDTFLAGYGLAQSLPGPLTAFAAFLGATLNNGLTGLSGGIICLIAIFLPSFLLVAGALPFWQNLRRSGPIRAALMGVNAAVVGLLLAALYTPVWSSAITGPRDFALGLAAFLALVFWKVPPWLVVMVCGMIGWLAPSI